VVTTSVIAFAATSGYWVESHITSYVVEVSPRLDVVTWCAFVGLGLGLVLTWSRRLRWGLANGIELDVSRVEALAGNLLFSAGAVLLVALVPRRVIRAKTLAAPCDYPLCEVHSGEVQRGRAVMTGDTDDRLGRSQEWTSSKRPRRSRCSSRSLKPLM